MTCRLFGAKPLFKPTLAGLLSIGPSGTNISDILIKIQKFSFTEMHLKISSAKWRPFYPGDGSKYTHLHTVPVVSCQTMAYHPNMSTPQLVHSAEPTSTILWHRRLGSHSNLTTSSVTPHHSKWRLYSCHPNIETPSHGRMRHPEISECDFP